jgi:mannitol operon transcriptional antiterminator
MTPGVGIEVICSRPQRLDLLHELDSQSNFQLILTAGQRQQFITLDLLTTTEPLILNHLQYIASVSRTTVLKDLEPVEEWLHRFKLALIRRTNYGLLLDGSELARRQALAALLWGDIPFGEPLTTMTYHSGLAFSLSDEAKQLPIVQNFSELFNQWDTQSALEWVASAEAQLGGRFTDNAVLHLALALAIQAQQVRAGQRLSNEPETQRWLVTQKVWPIALNVAQCIWPDLPQESLTTEFAGIAMHLLAGLRDHMWPGDLDIDPNLTELVTILMREVASAFNTPGLNHDTSLRDGLVAHIIPGFMRQRFGLWAPPSWSDGTLSRQYQYEYEIARELAAVVTEQTGVILPDGEIDTLTLLLRAAFIRERPNRPKRVFIICPSGMATAQLLVARLKARFPNLEILGVLSLRELSSQQVAGAQLLISTIPLQTSPQGLHVIQVHPLLLPEDIEAITQWLT